MTFLFAFSVGDQVAMPGPTAKNNPWADELKKSRRRRSRKGLSVSGKDEHNVEDNPAEEAVKQADNVTNLSETKADHDDTTKLEKKASLDEISKKCVKDTVNSSSKVRPPKVKPPSLPIDEDSRSLYQDARTQLRPVTARMISRQLSQEPEVSHQEALENPVDKIIRQDSMTGIKGRWTLSLGRVFLVDIQQFSFHLQRSKTAWSFSKDVRVVDLKTK